MFPYELNQLMQWCVGLDLKHCSEAGSYQSIQFAGKRKKFTTYYFDVDAQNISVPMTLLRVYMAKKKNPKIQFLVGLDLEHCSEEAAVKREKKSDQN